VGRSNTKTKAKKSFFGDRPLRDSKTPPYLTAEPEVTETRVRGGELLILASDGFWDHFSSEDAATCVWEWVKVTGEKTVKVPRRTGPWLQEEEYNVCARRGKDVRRLESNIGAFCSGELECRNPPHEECFWVGVGESFSAQPPLSRTARYDV